jgi:hypothetical protein
MTKYEQLIEHIINENEQAARELFHTIVVEKSREIYESLMDEDQVEENIDQYDQAGGLADDVSADETHGLGEDDEEAGEIELDGGDEMGPEEGGEEAPAEETFQNIKDAIADLEAEFAKLTGDDMDGEEEIGGELDGEESGEEDFQAGGEGDEEGEEMFAEAGNPFAKKGSGSGMSGSGKSGSGKSGSGKMTEAEMMREYVEKISAPSNTEGADNKGSVVAGKNDMGGTAANIAKGGSEAAPDGTSPKGKAGGFVKPAKVDNAGNINVPGGKAGNAFSTKAKAKTGEEGGVNDNSPLAK